MPICKSEKSWTSRSERDWNGRPKSSSISLLPAHPNPQGIWIGHRGSVELNLKTTALESWEFSQMFNLPGTNLLFIASWEQNFKTELLRVLPLHFSACNTHQPSRSLLCFVNVQPNQCAPLGTTSKKMSWVVEWHLMETMSILKKLGCPLQHRL